MLFDGYPFITSGEMPESGIEPLPEYDTVLFSQVWESADKFVTDYSQAEITPTITQEQARLLYYLLYARYGNAPIAFRDVNQFKYSVYSVIFQYAPTWQKRLEIQERLRGLTEAELRAGGRNVVNYALHPDSEPSTASTDEIKEISQQTATNHRKGIADAYATLLDFLEDDVTERFLERFRKLFLKFLAPYRTAIYPNDKED